MSETNEGSQVQSAELLMYAASEVNNTYHRIVGALKEFLDTGELPELAPVLPGSMGVVKGRKKREKGKRKPTAFNNFVKEKIHELRDQGDTEDDRSNNDLFARAVAEWGKLSPEEKKLYTDHYKEEEAEHEAAGQLAPEPQGAEYGDDEEEGEDEDEEEDERVGMAAAHVPATEDALHATLPAPAPNMGAPKVKKRKQKQLFQAGTLESPAETEQKKRKKKMNKDMPVIAA